PAGPARIRSVPTSSRPPATRIARAAPRGVVSEAGGSGDRDRRPLREIVRRPELLIAVGGAAVSYAAMVLVMTATPLAMVACAFPIRDVATVIQWHVLGMFVPSFFTGKLIRRFGTLRILLAGLALLGGHVVVAATGVEFLDFLSALMLLGVGWNFSYIAATTLLTEVARPEERAKVQALNEFTVFALVAAASLSSGWLFHRFDWRALNLSVLPLLLATGILMLWLARRRDQRNSNAGQ
ncbi:MAG: MFS transporter, partial [Gammaproteobacteria bacterium]|nr:MFS transporter [Gammaproteobacteria bacterium]